MAQNVEINPTTTSGGAVIHTDELSDGSQVQRIKIGTGNPGVYTDVSSSNPLPVSGDVSVGNTVAVSNAGLTELAAAINANELDVNLASSAATVTISGDVSVGNTVSVAGTVTANAGSGTFTVDGSGVTQPVSVASTVTVSDGAVVAALTGTLIVSDGAVVNALTSVTTSGAFRVNLDSSNVAIGGGTEYSVGTPLADEAGLGKLGLFKRDDALGGLTEAEGTLVPGRVDANGALWVVASPGDAETTDGASVHSLGVTRAVNVGFVSDPNELSVGANTIGMAGMNSERAIYVSIREDTVGIGGASTASDGTTHSLLQGTLTVSDGAVVSALGGTLTVDNGGTFAVQAAQSGTWNVTNVSGTVSLPTGASTAAKQPALGTAGTASSDVITVQGIASMTALTVDATGSGDVPITLGGEAVVLGAGTAGIGKLTANSGVDIGDVDVTSIAAGSNLIGDVGLQPRTSGGISTVYRDEDIDETAVACKAGAGQVYWIHCINLDATPVYLHFYDVAQGSVTVGTTGEKMSFAVPSSGDANGAGFNLAFPHGIEFSTAITIACTTTIGGTAGPGANEVILNVGYE